jgi:CubicO group peptidase (beta-lactamase class C family)
MLRFVLLALLALSPLEARRNDTLDRDRECSEVSSAFPLARSAEIDQTLERHLASGALPGAVVLVGHEDCIVFHRAYGKRSLEPDVEEMTIDTVFDLASLTKVVATAPAVMLLVERQQLRLEDTVSKHLPAFGRRGKEKVTIQQLLVHYSGLPADLRFSRRRKTSAKKLLDRIYQSRLVARPGQRFIYSDLGFMVLGKVVEKVSGQSLDGFVRDNLFVPLAMTSTGFLPNSAEIPRVAPTERRKDGSVIRGQVHDPLASRLGEVAGHAGLFSTSGDLARFCWMLLDRGYFDGAQILSSETVAKMTSIQSPEGKPDLRGLGWDFESAYSSAKGSFFSSRSYGHTGYTGTSIWIDPATRTFLVILTNRVHPDGKGDVKELRTELANIVGSALVSVQEQSTGIEPPN